MLNNPQTYIYKEYKYKETSCVSSVLRRVMRSLNTIKSSAASTVSISFYICMYIRWRYIYNGNTQGVYNKKIGMNKTFTKESESIYIYMCVFLCTYVCICIYIYVCTYVCMHVCLFVCMYICIMHICIHVYTYMYCACGCRMRGSRRKVCESHILTSRYS